MFLVSFALPAVTVPMLPGGGPTTMRGFECAKGVWVLGPLGFGCGFVNPLAAAYIFVRLVWSGSEARGPLAILALLLLPLSWILIAQGMRRKSAISCGLWGSS
jgi:hypothetical protein